jgi:hypothetical protein
MLFQGVAVAPTLRPTANSKVPARTFATGDGLKLGLASGAVTSLQVAGRELATNSASGFLVRDVAANSGFYSFSNGVCPELGLKLEASFETATNHIAVRGRLLDTRSQDRAVTLVFALPLAAAGWRWGDDIRHSRAIEGRGDFANSVAVRCGATGTMSLYPLAGISDEATGLGLALDMAHPALYRLGYHAGTRQLYLAYDFGLVPETQRFPGAAEFQFVLFHFDAHQGFRGAFQKMMEIFPDYFRVRSHEQGLWMPFTDIGAVEGWQEFGFRYHEGNNQVAWDDAHGILSFRYTEPMTWWMKMERSVPRTMEQAILVRDQLAKGSNPHERRMAQISQTASMSDDSGQPALLFREEPWCRGAVWSLNPNPALPVETNIPAVADVPAPEARYNAATVYWNEALKQSLYGTNARARLDGEYLDSLEGYVTADLNFRREHFQHTSVPLTFASDTKRPALHKGLAVFEFTKWLSDDIHRSDKLMFANGVPSRFSFLCPWLDVLGTETDWLQNGKYRPTSDRQMSLWRTMSGAKPYLLLMNTDFDAFNSELVERYFQRSLFYGMFPGMFSHNAADNPYWQNPKWYNRDRALFKKYLPLIKRVAEAGWQPVTFAGCDNDQVWVERFGPDANGSIWFTMFNDTAKPQTGTLHLEATGATQLSTSVATELLSNQLLTGAAGWQLNLEPQQAKLIELKRSR